MRKFVREGSQQPYPSPKYFTTGLISPIILKIIPSITMENPNNISVKDALERLSLPVFYNDDKRLTAYYVIMEYGNPVEKVMAEKVVGVYPFEQFSLISVQAA